jgi:DNA-binding transcriptional ArsR family regulator
VNEPIDFLKLLADLNRLRIALLLDECELFVCQLMGVLGISQPLVSRNLGQLERAGLARSRRRGKQVFYTRRDDLPAYQTRVLEELKGHVAALEPFRSDRLTLGLMRERFRHPENQGRCDMEKLRRFLDFQTLEKDRSIDHKETKSWNF